MGQEKIQGGDTKDKTDPNPNQKGFLRQERNFFDWDWWQSDARPFWLMLIAVMFAGGLIVPTSYKQRVYFWAIVVCMVGNAMILFVAHCVARHNIPTDAEIEEQFRSDISKKLGDLGDGLSNVQQTVSQQGKEIDRMKPRILDPQQRSKFVEAARKGASLNVSVITTIGDQESGKYCTQVVSALIEAGWKVRPAQNADVITVGDNIVIEISKQDNASKNTPLAANILAIALIDAKLTRFDRFVIGPDQMQSGEVWLRILPVN